MAKKTYVVTWSANIVFRSTVKANSKAEAERMAMNNDLSVGDTSMRECEPTYAEAELE